MPRRTVTGCGRKKVIMSFSPLQSTPMKVSSSQANSTVATALEPLVHQLLGDVNITLKFWDDSTINGFDSAGTEQGDDRVGTLHIHHPDALKRILWAPSELGVGRAFVSGDIDVDGNIFDVIAALRPAGARLREGIKNVPAAFQAARRLHVLGPPLPAPPEEMSPRWSRHSKARDAQVIHHHYDVGNEFYELILGPAMTYSCARFEHPDATLIDAQHAKHELICRKLGLHERPGLRMLDVGCGWGSLALHAAQHYDAHVTGITISTEQAEYARRRVHDAKLSNNIDIRLQDYRDVAGEHFDAISSVGMFEHVGKQRMELYFARLFALLSSQGRLLNHAISSVGGSKLGGRTFAYRYVFPDGELIDVGEAVLAMETAGFEVRDVESLREHYALTLRHWVANLQQHWDEAIELVGSARARIWLLYMATSAIGFEDGGLSIHQVLGIKSNNNGESGMALTRASWDEELITA